MGYDDCHKLLKTVDNAAGCTEVMSPAWLWLRGLPIV
jgi:hypothetical protein